MEENTKANYTGKNGSLLKTKNQVNTYYIRFMIQFNSKSSKYVLSI